MDLKHCSFIAACREFFGLKDGQTLQQFAQEIRELTPDDKAEMIQMFRSVGFDATKTAQPLAAVINLPISLSVNSIERLLFCLNLFTNFLGRMPQNIALQCPPFRLPAATYWPDASQGTMLERRPIMSWLSECPTLNFAFISEYLIKVFSSHFLTPQFDFRYQQVDYPIPQ